MVKMSPEEKYKSSLETKKRFYRKHRDDLLKKLQCPCGGSYDVFHVRQHINTQKHKKYELKENLL